MRTRARSTAARRRSAAGSPPATGPVGRGRWRSELPRTDRRAPMRDPRPRRVGQQVPQGDRRRRPVGQAGREPGQEFRDRVFEGQPVTLGQRQRGGRHQGLGERRPAEDRVERHREARLAVPVPAGPLIDERAVLPDENHRTDDPARLERFVDDRVQRPLSGRGIRVGPLHRSRIAVHRSGLNRNGAGPRFVATARGALTAHALCREWPRGRGASRRNLPRASMLVA